MALHGQRPAQVAYYVPDIRAAARRHAAMFGSGPFFAVDDIAFAWCQYRGAPAVWRQSSAFGQYGEIMIEFMQQDAPGDSVLYDLYPPDSGRYGLHHMAYIVDDPPAVAAALTAAGYPLALHGALANGIEVFMLDASHDYGHMLELYAPTPALRGIYASVREAARGWDGRDPVRPFSFD